MYRKKGFTTGDVAELCHVTIPTVIKWIESEELEGFKIPGSKNRRITRESLLKFMKKYKIPTNALEKTKFKVLIVDTEPEHLDEILDKEKYETRIVTRGFEAGLAKEFKPDLVLLNLDLPDIDGLQVYHFLRNIDEIKNCFIIGLTKEEPEENLLKQGFDDHIKIPFSDESLLEKIRKHLTKTNRRKKK